MVNVRKENMAREIIGENLNRAGRKPRRLDGTVYEVALSGERNGRVITDNYLVTLDRVEEDRARLVELMAPYREISLLMSEFQARGCGPLTLKEVKDPTKIAEVIVEGCRTYTVPEPVERVFDRVTS